MDQELSLWEWGDVGRDCYFNSILLKYFIEPSSDIYNQWQTYRLRVLFLSVLINFQ